MPPLICMNVNKYGIMSITLHDIQNHLSYALCSLPSIVKCKLHGVKIGKNNRFAGFPYFSRAIGSRITIGNDCRFVSRETGNLMGLNHRCIISTGAKDAVLQIGNNCGFSGTTIWCFKKIVLGDNVRVGANVTIMDGDAHQDDPRAGKNKDVTIGDNVWIGASCIIMKGVNIGKDSVIGAGSVVTNDIPDGVIAAGNPCRVIRTISK